MFPRDLTTRLVSTSSTRLGPLSRNAHSWCMRNSLSALFTNQLLDLLSHRILVLFRICAPVWSPLPFSPGRQRDSTRCSSRVINFCSCLSVGQSSASVSKEAIICVLKTLMFFNRAISLGWMLLCLPRLAMTLSKSRRSRISWNRCSLLGLAMFPSLVVTGTGNKLDDIWPTVDPRTMARLYVRHQHDVDMGGPFESDNCS